MPQYIWLALHLQLKFSVFWQGLHNNQQEGPIPRAPLGAPVLAVPYPQVLTAMPQRFSPCRFHLLLLLTLTSLLMIKWSRIFETIFALLQMFLLVIPPLLINLKYGPTASDQRPSALKKCRNLSWCTAHFAFTVSTSVMPLMRMFPFPLLLRNVLVRKEISKSSKP